MPTGNFETQPFSAYNRDFYGILGNVGLPGKLYGCYEHNGLTGINKTGTFLSFGRYLKSVSDLETTVTKKTGAGLYVEQLILPNVGTTADQITGVSLWRSLGNFYNDQNAWVLDPYSSQPQNGGFAAYYANELVTFTTEVDRPGMWVLCDGTAPAIGAPVQVSTVVGLEGVVSATGAVTLGGGNKVLAAPVSFAGTELAGYLAADNATHAVLVTVSL
jgi:hypothetical protein